MIGVITARYEIWWWEIGSENHIICGDQFWVAFKVVWSHWNGLRNQSNLINLYACVFSISDQFNWFFFTYLFYFICVVQLKSLLSLTDGASLRFNVVNCIWFCSQKICCSKIFWNSHKYIVQQWKRVLLKPTNKFSSFGSNKISKLFDSCRFDIKCN